ncbi:MULTISPECIES: thiolase family protein [Halomonadaceae]|uniref:Acetyl-CoA C-acyltransferase n=1 Tax=Vreelandella halophila TaxID=86177 RepID=A0A9X4YCS7_9GAMM|nr:MULTISPECIES: thiolase family protein [Halomonas]MYL25520.1 acetyl-CoA C-acyltransferase [Halomonas utahensis]MYL74756.1 acetyl-CoA C-acyltransferase [Halomonas sp. 22501_18_FS]
MHDPSIYITAARRTPMGGFLGALSPLSSPALGAEAVRAVLADSGLSADAVEEVVMGNVLPAGTGQGPARQAARDGGLPDSAGATTVNKLCGSGMKATMFGHDLIRAGSAEVVLTGGMESMSNAPYLLTDARRGYRMGPGQSPQDHMFMDGLQDAETDRLMGEFAQETADRLGYSREAMDAFAIRSLERANAAIDNGWLDAEMVPITQTDRKGNETTVSNDEQPGQANIDRIPSMRPAFAKDGTITAANASSISDGASALMLMSEAAMERHGSQPLARILGHATFSRHPSEFTLAPVGAIQRLLERTGWSTQDVDLYEINEAFAVVSMIAMDDLGLAPEKVNIHGGACAQGHPIGSTGSRLIVSLIHALRRTGGRRGIASLCIGGGEATAVAIELCD